ncbi:MAG TPA: chlorite dismutase family protein [Polyangiaceae bacterium]|nr:chlorite dismutase family protein [Polyangiaceae bacterium]
MAHEEAKQPGGLPTVDVSEYGAKRDGVRQSADRRLFMQLLVFDAPEGSAGDELAKRVADACARARVAAAVYADASGPRGVGLLTWNEDPSHFVRAVRPLFTDEELARLIPRPRFAMLGRTYSTGHEPELEWALLRRPVENVTNERYRWHVWYPLRRTAAFARLEAHDQAQILREHAQIGMAYGAQDLAHDVRLACYGLDAADNEFVIGLVGRDLHPLSHLVQAMRKTRQTSEFIEKMGPFFVGYVLHRVD